MSWLEKHSRAAGKPPAEAGPTRVLVTGASGFVGAHVIARLAETACEVVTLAGREITSDRVAALAPDVVIHLAAMTHPDACQAEPERAREANVGVTRRLARGAKPSCRRFIYASTDLVFDGERGGYSERDEPRPICVYGETKLEGERAAREELGERAIAIRLALLYGLRLEPRARPTFAEAMVARARAGEPVSLYLDQYRSPLYVEDAAESVVRLLDQPLQPSMPILHLGGSERCSRYEMGRAAFDVLGISGALARAVRMSEHRTPAPRPADVSLDSARARALGLPARGLREGFQSFRDRME
jgi:dTDP-4-dehydrorhamnose reductase